MLVVTLLYARQTNLNEEIYKILIPEEYLMDFEVNSVEEHPTEWLIELVEKPDRIPKELQGKEVVLYQFQLI